MQVQVVVAGLLVAALPQVALAEGFTGQFLLKGKTSGAEQHRTRVRVRIQANVRDGGFHVERYGQFPSGVRPQTHWTSTDAQFRGRTLVVVYRLGTTPGVDDSAGIVGRLGADPSDEDAAELLSQENVVRAAYVLSQDGANLREVLVNTTRLGDEAWWSQIKAQGVRDVKAAATLPPEVALRQVEAAAREWYREHIRATYAVKLAASDLTPQARAELIEARQRDLASPYVELEEGNYALAEWIYDAYANTTLLYYDALGEAVHYSHVQTYSLVFWPGYAGGLERRKPFAVDDRTGALLDTSAEVQEYYRTR